MLRIWIVKHISGLLRKTNKLIFYFNDQDNYEDYEFEAK